MKNFSKIYKYFLILFFKIYYGKLVFKNFDEKKYLSTKIVKIKNNNYKIYEINNCRVYTNTIDVAFIKNNHVLEKPSFQVRGNKYVKVTKNIVFTKGTPKFKKKINNRVFSLLSGVDASNNYYHWFFYCLPRFFLLSKFYKFNKNDFFLVPSTKHNYQKQSLNLLKISNLLDASNLKHIEADKIVCIDCVGKNIVDPSKPSFLKHQAKWLVKDFKFYFKKEMSVRSRKNNLKIYINRTGLSNVTRDITNKNDLIYYLKNNNFKIVDPSKLDFLKQIELFKSSRLIVGRHGAGLTNVIFCKKGTKIIELNNKNTENLYKNIIKAFDLNYYSLNSNMVVSNGTKKPWDGSINIDIKKLSKVIGYPYVLDSYKQ